MAYIVMAPQVAHPAASHLLSTLIISLVGRNILVGDQHISQITTATIAKVDKAGEQVGKAEVNSTCRSRGRQAKRRRRQGKPAKYRR